MIYSLFCSVYRPCTDPLLVSYSCASWVLEPCTNRTTHPRSTVQYSIQLYLAVNNCIHATGGIWGFRCSFKAFLVLSGDPQEPPPGSKTLINASQNPMKDQNITSMDSARAITDLNCERNPLVNSGVPPLFKYFNI